MIANERQLRISTSALREFEDAVARLEREGMGDSEEDDTAFRVLLDSMTSEIEILRQQIAQYDAIKRGDLPSVRVDFSKLGETLIRARIAAKLTQKQLAERVGIQEQQIQRYEAREYEHASFARLKEIVWALGINVSMHVPMPRPENRPVVQTQMPGLTVVPYIPEERSLPPRYIFPTYGNPPVEQVFQRRTATSPESGFTTQARSGGTLYLTASDPGTTIIASPAAR